MDSSSKKTLKQLLFKITDQMRKLNFAHKEVTISPSISQVEIVYSYILKLGNIKSEFKLLKNLPFGEQLNISPEMVASFIQDLQEFFIVSRLYIKGNANALNKKVLLAVFIDFLLQLLSCETDFVRLFGDRIDQLKKELRYLVTILGDISLPFDELEQVNDLLAEFEAVANEAGNFVYSFIFAMDRVSMTTTMDDALANLLRCIDDLKNNVTCLSIRLPYISNIDITAKTAAADSVFIVDSLLHDLKDLMNPKHNLTVDVKAPIIVLHRELMLSQSFLNDIKVPQYSEIEVVKGPVMQIRNLAYEAEYLVNSFLVGDVPHDYLTFRLPDIIDKIKRVGTKLQEIKKNYDRSGVLKVVTDLNAQLSLQAKRTLEVDDVSVGLDAEAVRILDLLLGGTERRQIITIFGMPGLGKTTLAKKLYNHPSVNYYFDKCSWCVVSQTYQTKSILISLGSEIEKVELMHMDEGSLGEHIYKSLKGKRYLIVMDDVWVQNAWYDFQMYFPDDKNGSRILFTSRHKDVAPPDSIIHPMPYLSKNQSWELLQKKVFHDKPCPPPLQKIGREIAENCQGLPLAVVVAAGILSTMHKEESAWKNVGRSLASYIFSSQNNSTMQILKLSYNYLPDHLKSCFLYFGAFPEAAEIPSKKLKHFWIAEGFMHKEELLKNAENLAEEYLMELIDRSLVMVAKRRSNGGVKACVVHDLLHDFNYSIYTKGVRLHVRGFLVPSVLPFGFHIRSLFGSRLDSISLNYMNMKLLKLLDLPRNSLSDGDGSEHLVRLRYLAIEHMPVSINSLVNLEFLIVMRAQKSSGHKKTSISSAIQKLVKLKHLSVPNAYFDENCNSYQTNNLEFLSNVVIDKLDDVEMLKCSPNLRTLKCKFAESLEKHDEYHYPDLRFLNHLESLNVSNLRIGVGVEINFPSNIKKLTLGDFSLPCEKMSIIGGLPKLEVLKLQFGALVEERWDTKDGEFQQLRFLRLVCIRITQWNVASKEHFPRLQRLVLWHCYDLEEIPCEIGEIAALQMIEVKSSQKSLAESAKNILQEQQEMGNEELSVIITDIIDKIESNGTELHEIKKTYDTETSNSAESSRAKQSLQVQRKLEVDDIPNDLENVAKHILEPLLERTAQPQRIITTIFGMPGVGKTTVAKKLYNHPMISEYFDSRCWCIVSQTYQRRILLIDILISLDSELDKVKLLDMEDKYLGRWIYESLTGRRCFIVLDDVWDSNAWLDVLTWLPPDDRISRSRILLTSHIKDVAPPGSKIYELPSLSNDG